MIELSDWIQTIARPGFPHKPWLILGKGPTFSRRSEVDLAEYNTISLNHAVRELHVDVAHIIDIDVVEACAEALLTNCDWLLMPRRPHVRGVAGEVMTLSDWLECMPVLRALDQRGGLVCYELSQAPAPPDSPVIQARNFSSEAALNILARMNVKTVRSLGVDGGRSYSAAFDDLRDKTLLAYGQPSFDLQFAELERIAATYSIDYRPIFEPMRIFVGTEESQTVATKVLAYSIQKHASAPVRVTPMVNLNIPLPKDEKNRPRTGFSFSRFVIPQLAGYRGRALYLDADMLVFSDVAELWDIPFGKQRLLCTYQETPDAWKDNPWFHPGRQFSVMLLDCDRLDWKIEEIISGLDEGKFSYRDLLFNLCLVNPDEIEDRIPPEWNHLERYEPGKTKLLHYTVIPTQPWNYDDHPLGYLWISAFTEALRCGFVSGEDVESGIAKGHLSRRLAQYLNTSDDTRGSAVEERVDTTDWSLTRKIQHLEHLLRQSRADNTRLEDVAACKARDLADRVRAHDQEIAEYRQKVSELESRIHELYRSRTWKVGRLITKPLAALKHKTPAPNL